MKLLIAGSRTINDYELLKSLMHRLDLKPDVIVSGGAKGVDTLAERYAVENNIPFEKYEANWKKYGKSAGPIRNAKMAKIVDHALIIWDGESSGTKSMILFLEMYDNVKEFFVYVTKQNNSIFW